LQALASVLLFSQVSDDTPHEVAGLQRVRNLAKAFNVTATSLLFLCLVLPFARPGYVRGATGLVGPYQNEPVAIDVPTETSRILAALETRTSNRKLIDMARSKLVAMDERQTRLLSELSDRVGTDGTSIGSNVAFLLITILVALS
jgi:hypothetical protein